ncbi:MAG: phage virion morphogenesis protein [Thermomonas sp.]|uniref:phage virion morphogenesis protein n=1 Tax=Thermomonas sp. TaxID=1971895 RepID=UPI00261F63B2|nr:phage virion morphogenesis protein [Thermomonas sp.]MCC7097278.1 phage virion morphogenesis protein [Thermomonas sp.]
MITIDLKMADVQASVRRAMQLLDNMTPVYTGIGEYMVEATRARFRSGIAPDGTRWPAKSQATLDRYKAMGYGNLNRVLIGPSRRLSREVQRFVSRDGVVIGSSLIYAGVMQRGAAKGAFGRDSRGRPIPWGRIPARVWLGLSQEDVRSIEAIVEEHIAEALNQSG